MGNIKSNYQKTQNPPFTPQWKVALTVLPKLKEMLDRLLNAGVVTTLGHPTKRVNSLVIVEKKDSSLRLCLNPKDLKECILRHFKAIDHLKKFRVNCRTKDILLLLILNMYIQIHHLEDTSSYP